MMTNASMINPTMKSFKTFADFLLGLLILSFTWQLQAAPIDNSFGRLFSTPNERNKLDYLRQNQKLKIVSPKITPQPEDIADAAPTPLPNPIILQGYVKRSDGKKRTLWINNQAVQEDSSVDNVQIGRLYKRANTSKGANINGSSEGLDLKILANGKHIRLKAGQVYEPETNQIIELKMVDKDKRLNLEERGLIDDGNDLAVSKP